MRCEGDHVVQSTNTPTAENLLHRGRHSVVLSNTQALNHSILYISIAVEMKGKLQEKVWTQFPGVLWIKNGSGSETWTCPGHSDEGRSLGGAAGDRTWCSGTTAEIRSTRASTLYPQKLLNLDFPKFSSSFVSITSSRCRLISFGGWRGTLSRATEHMQPLWKTSRAQCMYVKIR